MTMPEEMPTYRQWEKFWSLHLTPEFRDADAHATTHGDCNALASLDALRGFLSALAGVSGDAPIAVSVNHLYVQIANHLAELHEFDMRDDADYTEGDLDEIRPVVDQLFASLGISPILIMVRRVVEDERSKYN